MKVKDTLIELLAIALYESELRAASKLGAASWLDLREERREIYRRLARDPLPPPKPDA